MDWSVRLSTRRQATPVRSLNASMHQKGGSTAIFDQRGKEDESSCNCCRFNMWVANKTPLLYLDINIGGGMGTRRVKLFEEDDPATVARLFAEEHSKGSELHFRYLGVEEDST